MGKIIGKVSSGNGSEQIVGNVNTSATEQISGRISGSNLGQITGNVNGSNVITSNASGSELGTLNGRVLNVIDAADLQKQINELKERDIELFNFANDIRLDLQAEIIAKFEEVESLLSSEARDRQAADAEISAQLLSEVNRLLRIINNLEAELRAELNKKVDKVNGKGLSTNDFTNELKDKLDSIESGAEVNTIESISVNGIQQEITNKNVNITVPEPDIPTKTSDLINDGDGTSIFTTKDYVDDALDEKQDWLEFNPEEIPVSAVTLTGIKDGNKVYVIPQSGQTVDWSDVANKPAFKEVAVTADYTDLINTPIFNTEIPTGITPTPLSVIKDGNIYYTVDSSTAEVRPGEIVNFKFENGAEITYSNSVSSNCILTIPNNISQGFISLLTISNMEANKTISIKKESLSIPYDIRIVNDNTRLPGTSYTTGIAGKKIIFARCDGVDIEILVIEELEG